MSASYGATFAPGSGRTLDLQWALARLPVPTLNSAPTNAGYSRGGTTQQFFNTINAPFQVRSGQQCAYFNGTAGQSAVFNDGIFLQSDGGLSSQIGDPATQQIIHVVELQAESNGASDTSLASYCLGFGWTNIPAINFAAGTRGLVLAPTTGGVWGIYISNGTVLTPPIACAFPFTPGQYVQVQFRFVQSRLGTPSAFELYMNGALQFSMNPTTDARLGNSPAFNEVVVGAQIGAAAPMKFSWRDAHVIGGPLGASVWTPTGP